METEIQDFCKKKNLKNVPLGQKFTFFQTRLIFRVNNISSKEVEIQNKIPLALHVLPDLCFHHDFCFSY